MTHWSLMDYYVFIDQMVSSHKYTKYDIDAMYPFERDVLISIINDRIESNNQNQGEQIGPWEVQSEAPTD